MPVYCPYLIDSLDIDWPDILILDVEGMLPDIYAKQGDKTSGDLEPTSGPPGTRSANKTNQV